MFKSRWFLGYLFCGLLLLATTTSSLQVFLTDQNPSMCFLVKRDYDDMFGLWFDSVDIHYDTTGLGAEQIEFSAFQILQTTRKRLVVETGVADGQYMALFGESMWIEVCFRRLDYQKKEVTFIMQQKDSQRKDLAQMSRLERITTRLANMKSLFEIISHNLETKMTLDRDLEIALESAKNLQTYASSLKMLVVIIMCGIQVFFLTFIFRTKPIQAFTKSVNKLQKAQKSV